MVFGVHFTHAQRNNDRSFDQNDRYEQYDDRYERSPAYCPPNNRNVRVRPNRNFGNYPNSNRRIQISNRIFSQYDRNNDGRLRYNEFNDIRMNGRRIQDARRKFRRVDWNDNGWISRSEFIDALERDQLR